MSTIDSRIVEMRFDNKQFESGVKESLNTLDNLNNVLNKGISSDSFKNLEKAANNVNLSGISAGVEALTERFSALGIMGMRVIENITDGLMNGVAKGISVATDAIVKGGVKRAMNIENAHFQLQGLIDDEKEVTAIMDDAMQSVDGTAYAYDEAAKAASMFAATGLRSGEEMQRALKAIAGTAATTNSDYESLSQIFTTIAGQGKVMAVQLNQFATRGLNAAATLTQYFNDVNSGAIKVGEGVSQATHDAIREMTHGWDITEGDLRDFVSEGEISFDIFSEAMAQAFGDHAKDANKTFNGAMSNIRAALARTGALFVSPLIEQEGPLVDFFNSVREKVNELNGALKPIAENATTFINNVIPKLTAAISSLTINADDVGKAYQTFVNLLGTIKNLAIGIGTVLRPVIEVIKEFIPKDLIDRIVTFTENLKNMTSTLKLSDENTKNLKSTVRGIIDLVLLLANAVKSLLGPLVPLAKDILIDLGSGLLMVTGKIGEFVSGIKDAADKFNVFENVSKKIIDVITNIRTYLSSFVSTIKTGFEDGTSGFILTIKNLFDKMSGIFNKFITHMSEKFSFISNGFKSLVDGFKGLINSLSTMDFSNSTAFSAIANVLSNITNTVKKLFSTIAEAVKNADLKRVLRFVIGGALVEGILNYNKILANIGFNIKKISETVTLFKRSVRTITNSLAKGLETGFGFSGVFSSIKASLKSFQKEVSAKTLMDIAIALGILTLSVVALSGVDTKNLAVSLGAVGTLMAELIFSFKQFSKNINPKDAIKLAEIAASLILLSFAVTNFAIALRIIAGLDWQGLLKGMTGLSVILLDLVVVTRTMNKDAKGMITIATSFIVLSIAVNILVGAVKKLAQLSWEQLVKGLLGVAAILTELGLFAKFVDTDSSSLKTSAGLILLAIAVNMLYKAVSNFGSMDIMSLVKGIAAIGVLLIELKSFVEFTSGSTKMITVCTGMILLAAAMNILAVAVEKFGSIYYADLVKGLLGLGIALGELTIAMKFLPANEAIAKSIALGTLSASMILLATAVRSFGNLSWDELARGLTAMGGALIEIFLALKFMPGDVLGKVAMLAATFASLKILASVMLDLSQLNWNEVAISLTAMGGALAEVVLATKYAEENISGVISLTLLVGTLCLLMIPLKELAEMSWSDIARSLLVMAGALTILVSASFILGKIKASDSILGVGILLSMVLVLKLLVDPLKQLSSLSWQGVGAALSSMGGALTILTGIVYILSNMRPEKALIGIGALLGLSLTLILIADPLIKLSAMSWTGVGAALTSMGGALAIMSGIAILLGQFPTSLIGVVAMLGLAATLMLISDPLLKLSTIPWSGVTSSLLLVSGALSAMALIAALIGAVPELSLVGIAGMLGLALTLVLIADPLVQLSQVSWEGIGKALVLMGGALLELVGITALLTVVPQSLVGIVALLGLALTLQLMVPPLMALSTLDWDQVKVALVAMGGALAVLGTVSALLGIIGPAALAGAVVLVTLSGTLLIAGTALSMAASIIAVGIQDVVDSLNSILEIDPEELEEASEHIGKAIAHLGDGLAHFASNSLEGGLAMVAVAKSLDILLKPMKEYVKMDMDKLSNSFKTLATGLGKFGDTLKNFSSFSILVAPSLVMVAEAINKLGVALPMLSMVDPDKLSDAMDRLATGFSKFGQSLKSFGLISVNGASAIGIIGIAIKNMAPALTLLTTVESGEISVVLNALGDAFAKFGEALDTTPFWGTKGRAEGISILVDNVGKLVQTLPALIELDYISVNMALSTIKLAFIDFGKALSEAPFWGTKSRAEGIGILVDNVASLTSALPQLIEMDATSVRLALSNLSLGFTGFAAAIDAAPFWGTKGRAEGITTLVDSIMQLTTGVSAFSTIDADVAKTTLTTLSEGFSQFGSTLYSTPLWGAESGATGIATLVDSIMTLKIGLENFSTLNTDEVKNSMDSISKAFSDFGTALYNAPMWTSEGRASGIAKLVKNIDDLAAGVNLFIYVDADAAASALETISAAFVTFGEAINSTPIFTSEGRAEALGKVIGYISDLVTPLQQLSSIVGIHVIFDRLGAFIAGLGESIDSLGLNASYQVETLEQIVLAVTDMAQIDMSNVPSVVNGIESIIETIKSLTDVDTSTIATLAEDIKKAVATLFSTISTEVASKKEFTESMGRVALGYLLNGLTKNQKNIQEAASKVASQFVSSFNLELKKLDVKSLDLTSLANNISTQMKTAGTNAISSFTSGLSSSMNNLTTSLSTFVSTVKLKLTLVTTEFKDKGTISATSYSSSFSTAVSTYVKPVLDNFVEKIKTVIRDLIEYMYDTGEASAKSFANGIKNNVSSVTAAVKDMVDKAEEEAKKLDFKKVGEDAVKGFVNGISENAYKAEAAGKKLGNSAYNASKKALDEHSPSRKMGEVGNYAGEGFVNALVSWISSASKAGEEVGTSALDGIKESISRMSSEIQNEGDFTPTITPILDLSNLQNASSSISSMLNFDRPIDLAAKAGLSFTGSLSNMLNNIQASIPDNSNDDVVEAINGLRSDMDIMNAKIANMQIVMDSGELVGAIASPLDNQLGFNATMIERGVL